MDSLDNDLTTRIREIELAGLKRALCPIDAPSGTHVVRGGQPLLNFASNDYLGLANHPSLLTAAESALKTYGAGSAASRLISGSLRIHHDLEETLADWKGTEASLLFSSGYMAALAVAPTLLTPDDVVVVDRRIHACCLDAAKASRALLRVFRHNDTEHLEEILAAIREKGDSGGTAQSRRILIITESVFSMDGDIAPLRELVTLKEKYGAWLMVDEAHAVGLFGGHRSGLIEELGLSKSVEIQMGTLGKAVGTAGGYLCGSRTLIDFLINRARTFIFSTAPAPATSAATIAAIQLIQGETGTQRCTQMWRIAGGLRNAINHLSGVSLPTTSGIVPWVVGPEETACKMARQLMADGFYVPAIRFPSVAHGSARLRFTASASHTDADLESLVATLGKTFGGSQTEN
jgi:8-amino-7-oxononanoate synthase